MTELQNRKSDFLGCGWKFPPQIDAVTGRVKMSCGEESIRESVRAVLFTGKGERAILPEFGCDIGRYAFSDMSRIDQKSMEQEVVDALIRWEPRILHPKAQIKTDRMSEGMVEILVSCTVRTTNNPYNMVFPYYLSEGSSSFAFGKG